MITEEQTAVIELLASADTHGGTPVERIDTHGAIVFLAGHRALKLKRAVRYDYMDFSTADRRRVACEAEVRINRRAAPALYRGVVAVTRERDGSLALGGPGAPVDWLVDMNRFDQEGLFDRLAEKGALGLELMHPLALAIARFHSGAEPRPDYGGRAGMTWIVNGNDAGFAEFGAGVLDAAACARVTRDSLAAIGRLGELLEDRRQAGLVRQCHGDLHLRNIVLIDGLPTLFDAIEFNDQIACTDVLYDLAFLLMDLWRRKLPRHANAVWNGYLSVTGEYGGIRLLPLFLSCRAAVRAKTSATAARFQGDPNRRRELEALSRDYLAMAEALLQPPPPCVIAVGGLSGSGKSTLAKAIAPAVGPVPGAVVIRSDEVRKKLCGAAPLDRLGPESYTPEVSRRVYAAVEEHAAAVAGAGHSAIVDAVFAQPADREAIERVAAETGVPFVGIWLDAEESVLIERTQSRTGDPSDADPDVVRQQVARSTGVIGWRRIDAAGPPVRVLREGLAVVAATGGMLSNEVATRSQDEEEGL